MRHAGAQRDSDLPKAHERGAMRSQRESELEFGAMPGLVTFDCYGTLIDWESGIFTALQPLLAEVPSHPGRDEALETFAGTVKAAAAGS